MQQIPCQPAGDRFLPDLVYITFGLHKKRKKRIDNLFDLWCKVRKVIRFLQEADRMESMQDKFMTTVRIGPKGQIVIPKEVRAMFGLEPGVNNYFKNSFKEMVSFFAKDEKISPEDLKDIIREIENSEE